MYIDDSFPCTAVSLRVSRCAPRCGTKSRSTKSHEQAEERTSRTTTSTTTMMRMTGAPLTHLSFSLPRTGSRLAGSGATTFSHLLYTEEFTTPLFPSLHHRENARLHKNWIDRKFFGSQLIKPDSLPKLQSNQESSRGIRNFKRKKKKNTAIPKLCPMSDQSRLSLLKPSLFASRKTMRYGIHSISSTCRILPLARTSLKHHRVEKRDEFR